MYVKVYVLHLAFDAFHIDLASFDLVFMHALYDVCSLFVYPSYVRILAYIYVHICAYIHTHMYIYIYIDTHKSLYMLV